MGRRITLTVAFTLGLLGGGALAAGWYSATATVENGVATPAQVRVVGGAHRIGGDTRVVTPTSGRWILTESGAVMWVTDDQVPPGARTPNAQWYADRARELQRVADDLECQISGIGCTVVEDLNQGY